MKTLEGHLEAFMSEPEVHIQEIFTGERFPNVVVSTDGTVLATWGRDVYRVRRSEDGGKSWGPAIEVTEPGFHGGGVTVDEVNSTVIVFAETEHPPREPQETTGPLKVFRSADHGRTWEPLEVVIHPDPNGHIPARHMCEHGITLRRGPHAGRLLRPARVYNKAGEKPLGYSLAIHSDDGGQTWHSSAPFPAVATGESGVVELQDGEIYHNTRRHYFDSGPEGFRWQRHIAWSYDGGETWRDLEVDAVLPDGPRYRGDERRGSNFNGHFGMLAGLVRLPVKGLDILLYSNADTPSHRRVQGTVWASFDGGRSWPVKRLVHDGPFAYSSMDAGRPGTPSEGKIFLQYEGGEEDCYEGGWIARFNLSWLLAGETTGDGEVPNWVLG